ncbi:MAG: hypothetical protein JNK58_01725 [Phycisphaerae bacterium]|nr:hypothetical protein [Phycisphaerae bacterium]
MSFGSRASSYGWRSWLSLAVLFGVLGGSARADVPVCTQPPNAAGGQYKSSWYAPDGLDSDEYVWDAFTLPADTAITEIQWRGAYTNYLSGAGLAPVYNFTVAIYASIPAGSQPDVNGRLVRYFVGGNAGETPAGSAGGVAMYDYHFVLPSPFQVTGGTKYWLQIIAWQGLTPTYHWPPDWSFARGTGGEGSHFRRVGGTGGSYTSITGDCAFTLLASAGPSASISATSVPPEAAVISGAGTYPVGSVASLTATPNHGWGFVNWTENANQVSTNPTYAFTVTGSRVLEAHFVPAFIVSTNSLPDYGGTTAGGGTYNEGANVTVVATPNQGFVFSQWTWFGTPMSTEQTYSFPATSDITLTAEFVSAPGSATFDFDDAPVHTSLPIALASGGVGAVFTATGGGFSVQPVGTVGIAPPGFSGLYLFPNSVFPADLIVDFSATLVDFSMLYAVQELGCDDSATMRVTVFMDGVQVGTNTATVPIPGTYPSGTLSIAVPSGFNRAVVHYASPPPTCHDYGVIFFADNLTVTQLCAPPTIEAQPFGASACPGGSVYFFVSVAGTGPFSYQWYVDFVPIDADLNPSAATDALVLTNVQANDTGNYRCVVNTNCGQVISDPAPLTVSSLQGDANASGGVDFADITSILSAWGADYQPATGPGDANYDGVVNFADITEVLANFGSMCP